MSARLRSRVMGGALLAAFALALLLTLATGSTPSLRAAPGTSQLSVSQMARVASRHVEAWRFSDAQSALHLLEAMAPKEPEVVLARAKLHYLQGRYGAARDHLRKHFGQTVPPGVAKGAAEIEATYQLTRGFLTHRTASGHFVISYPPGLESILIPYAAQALEKARSALQAELGLLPDGPVRVEILPGPEALAQASPLTLDAIRRTGTIALSRAHRIMIITPRALATGYGWLDTLSHEFIHYLLEVKARHHVDLWLHEGLARFLQDRWRRPLPKTLTPLQQHRLAGGLKRGLVPIRRMMPSFAMLKDHREAGLAYAQVASMILYLHQKHGSAGLKRLIDALASGKRTDQALKAAAGMSQPRLLAQWKAHLRSLRLRPIPVFTPLVRRFKKSPASASAASSGRAVQPKRTPFGRYRRLGGILRAHGRTAAATKAYAKALGFVKGADGRTANTLARLLHKLGRSAEADQVIRRALPYAGEMAALHVVAARVAQQQNDARRAEAHLWLANGIDPFDPEIHQRLATLLDARGDAAGAKRERQVTGQLRAQP